MNTIIDDKQIVDYILRVLPEDAHQRIEAQITSDPELQQRLAQWEQVLFRFNNETADVKPPKAVWHNIENKLFPEQLAAKSKEKKHGFGRYLIPAFFSLAVLFTGNYYFVHQPSYHAQVIATKNAQPLWEIEGNKNHITFTSINNAAMPNMDCQAWIVQADGQPIRLGAIPDTGHDLTKRVQLPDSLSVSSGDKVIIVMTKKGYKEKLPPAGVPIMNTVTLAAI